MNYQKLSYYQIICKKNNLVQDFLEIVKENPDKTAVICENEEYTYQDLFMRVDECVQCLLVQGIKKNMVVAVLLKRSISLISILMALQIIGVIYVPLDYIYPVKRILYILEKAKVCFMLHDEVLDSKLIHESLITININDVNITSVSQEELSMEECDDEKLMYIIFTSGTTGNPKGVAVFRKSFYNVLQYMKNKPGCSKEDYLLAITTICFDIAGIELFLPLVTGAVLDIVKEETTENIFFLSKRISQAKPTIIQATPSLWEALTKCNLRITQNMKIWCGGEKLDFVLAKKLLHIGSEVWNLYGPTETTVWSFVEKIETDQDFVSIGEPIEKTIFFIINNENKEAEEGEPGELYIGGLGVAKGYYNDERLSAEKFIIHKTVLGKIEKVFKTGDLVQKKKGKLVFIDRIDRQIKKNGYRIELGEIERVLNKCIFVKSTRIIANKLNLENKIIAFAVLKKRVSINTIYSYLLKYLPSYMLPDRIIIISKIPLLPNGKTDYKSLEKHIT